MDRSLTRIHHSLQRVDVTHGDLRVELLCYRECIFRVLATGENINYGNDGIYKSESRRTERWDSTRPM